VPAADGETLHDEKKGFDLGPSLFHRKLAAEVENVLTGSLQKRLGRIQGSVNGSTHGRPQRISTACTAVEVQTVQCSMASTGSDSLREAMKKAYRRAAIASRPKPSKLDFGASKAQTKLPDPPEKKDDSVREGVTLANTMKCVTSKISDRERQVANLEAQLSKCKEISEQTSEDLKASQRKLGDLQKKTTSIPVAHTDRLKQRRERIASLRNDLVRTQKDAKSYKALVGQQQAYQMQSDFFHDRRRSDAVNSHPAGEIFLTLKPRSVADERTEAWDVGTAIANPYVCDSWPFEPNVLANRTFGNQIDLQAWKEEDAADSDVDDDEFEPITREEFQTAFKAFDTDGNGYISATELGKALRSLGQDLTDAEVAQIVREADVNGDGQLDYEEFITNVMAK
jgi:hypothetical protein